MLSIVGSDIHARVMHARVIARANASERTASDDAPGFAARPSETSIDGARTVDEPGFPGTPQLACRSRSSFVGGGGGGFGGSLPSGFGVPTDLVT
jgi:hypothetical protein